MLNFVKNFLSKRAGKNEYHENLKDFLSDGKLDKKEKKELEELAKKYNLNKQDLLGAHKKICSLTFSNIINDNKITEEEKKSLEELMNYFSVNQKDFNFNQKTFNKFYTLGLIDKGILPEIKNHDIDVVFKKGEILRWGCPGILKKYKRITHRINYAGPQEFL